MVMTDAVTSPATKTPQVVAEDPWLTPYAPQIIERSDRASAVECLAVKNYGSLATMAAAYTRFGIVLEKDGSGLVCREYAPGASSMHLMGDFNGWSRTSHPFVRGGNGPAEATKIIESDVWELRLPQGLPEGCNYKLLISSQCVSEPFERVSPWARRVLQDSATGLFCPVFYREDYDVPTFKSLRPARPAALRIYECHVGISSSEPRIATYSEFTANVLPRIAELGYNTIQLMAIQEHAYYASFGYQVTSFYAPSSRFGTPNDLRNLVDRAHELGLVVLLDLVHSHASKNTLDGLNLFDGTDHCFFHGGARGLHPLWDSRIFNYGSIPTLLFLLGNCRYWLDTFNFDGFRFDGVTSMLYRHHGAGAAFSGNYCEYFDDDGGCRDLAQLCAPFFKSTADASQCFPTSKALTGSTVDTDAVVYLMLANKLVHDAGGLTIAEDVSGMPTLARPIEAGGIGFDYRLAMAAPDMWIKFVKELRDEDWPIGHMVHTLTNHRGLEPVVAYTESHDQALVGDKTLAFWLMDSDMYTNMSDMTELTPRVARGLALHKMMRLVTLMLGGSAYLAFMGNEFGHPEWLDFPRAGNNNSLHYARRQWNLCDDSLLRYRHLVAFDRAMMRLDDALHVLASYPARYVSLAHEDDKVLVFELAGTPHCVCVFNFHPCKSFADYRIGVPRRTGHYTVVLDSDDAAYGGFNRVDAAVRYVPDEQGACGRAHSLMVYLPSRTAQVYQHDDS